MREFAKILCSLVTIALIGIVFMLAGVSLSEGVNIFDPYIDTKFRDGYNPEDIKSIKIGQDTNEVKEILGAPLYTGYDTFNRTLLHYYTSDGKLADRGGDFAWFRSHMSFDSLGKVCNINYGWSYD